MRGIARQFDGLGRIVIPMEYRRTFGLQDRDPVEICLENNILRVKPCKHTPDNEITGVKRKLDDLGRIVVPMEFRRSLSIKDDDFIEMYLEKGTIVLKVIHLKCVFCECEEEEKLIERMGVLICEKCAKELGQVVKYREKIRNDKEIQFAKMLKEIN